MELFSKCETEDTDQRNDSEWKVKYTRACVLKARFQLRGHMEDLLRDCEDAEDAIETYKMIPSADGMNYASMVNTFALLSRLRFFAFEELENLDISIHHLEASSKGKQRSWGEKEVSDLLFWSSSVLTTLQRARNGRKEMYGFRKYESRVLEVSDFCSLQKQAEPKMRKTVPKLLSIVKRSSANASGLGLKNWSWLRY